MSAHAATAYVIDLTPWLDDLNSLEAAIQRPGLDQAALWDTSVTAWAMICGVHRAPRTEIGRDTNDAEAVAVAVGDQLVGTATGAAIFVDLSADGPTRTSFHVGPRTLRLVGEGSTLVSARLSDADAILIEATPESKASTENEVEPELQTWVAVRDNTMLLDTEQSAVGSLQPDKWYRSIDERQGWVAVVDDVGSVGWIPVNSVAARTSS